MAAVGAYHHRGDRLHNVPIVFDAWSPRNDIDDCRDGNLLLSSSKLELPNQSANKRMIKTSRVVTTVLSSSQGPRNVAAGNERVVTL